MAGPNLTETDIASARAGNLTGTGRATAADLVAADAQTNDHMTAADARQLGDRSALMDENRQRTAVGQAEHDQGRGDEFKRAPSTAEAAYAAGHAHGLEQGKQSAIVGFDESYDSIDPVSGAPSAGAQARRRQIIAHVREAHNLEVDPSWPEALVLWTALHDEGGQLKQADLAARHEPSPAGAEAPDPASKGGIFG